MYNIKTLNKLTEKAKEQLDGAMYAVSDDTANPDAILLRSEKLHDTVFNPELLCIARAGAGVNNIPVDRCADEGIVVLNTPGANAEAVKELVIASMLLSSRDLLGGIEWVKTIAGSDDVAGLIEKGKANYVGPEIFGKTLGVVGLGAIGAKIANAATALGMTVYGFDPYLSVESALRLSSEIRHAKDLDTIYKNSDYITIHVPYMDSTRHMINKETITKMKQGVRIINLARAELVNDDDILIALESGKVSCYVTDFPNGRTAGAKGVIAIPHLGASTPESEDNCASMACSELVEYLECGNIVNAVNMPSAYLMRTNDPRVCVIHDNVPEMISKITGAVSSFGVNIENMINASTKGRIPSYTMLDVSSVPDGLTEAVKKIDGVTRVRILKGR